MGLVRQWQMSATAEKEAQQPKVIGLLPSHTMSRTQLRFLRIDFEAPLTITSIAKRILTGDESLQPTDPKLGSNSDRPGFCQDSAQVETYARSELK